MNDALHAGAAGCLEDVECPLHVDVEALVIKSVILVDSRVTGSDCQMEHRLSTAHGREESLPIEDIRPHVPRIAARYVWGEILSWMEESIICVSKWDDD
jgi:hypothetical protein